MVEAGLRRADGILWGKGGAGPVSIAIAVLIGALTGVLSGLGVGGGTLLLLWMTAVMGMDQARAGGVNLLYFIACALPAVFGHIKNGLIEKKAVFWCVIFGVPACITGSLLAAGMDMGLLKRLFGGFILIIGVKELFYKNRSQRPL